MFEGKALGAYLTDHMAGSASASDLAKRAAASNEGPVGRFFADLAREIDTDRRTLKSIASRVEVEPNPLKQVVAAAAERLSRFKIDHRFTSNPPLSLLLELELLHLGIEGKLILWRTLEAVATKDQRLSEFDFAKLSARAQEQRDAVEEQRLKMAGSALAS